METVIVVEVMGAHERVQSRHRFAAQGGTASCTIGRGVAADVIIDDPHAAAVHARLDVNAAGDVTVTDLESINGVEMDGRLVGGAVAAPLAGEMLRIGRTWLRVRTARESLPAEVSDHNESPLATRGRDYRWLSIGAAVAIAFLGFSVWTTTPESRDLTKAMVATLLVVLAIAGAWIALWALVSRVGLGESRWLRHAAIFFCALAAIEVISMLVDVVSGALGLYPPASAAMLIFGILTAAALALHLVNASPMRRRFAIAIGVLIPAILLGAGQWAITHGQDRSAYYTPDQNEMVPPALLLHAGVPLDAFVADLARLKAKANAKRVFVEREDPSPSDDAEE